MDGGGGKHDIDGWDDMSLELWVWNDEWMGEGVSVPVWLVPAIHHRAAAACIERPNSLGNGSLRCRLLEGYLWMPGIDGREWRFGCV